MSKERRELTLPEIAKRAGVEYRTLKVWVEKGLLGRVRYQGTGHTKLFTERQARLADQLADLRHAGLTFDALRRVARALREGDTTCPICGSKRLEVTDE